VSAPAFADHYEALQLSPSADQETIERVFRLLAKRYHPDNNASGDADRFNQILEAYETLSDSSARAAYDVRHEAEDERRWQIRREGMSGNHRAEDEELFHRALSLLYIAPRRDPEKGGLAPARLEWMLGTPREHLEFPLWYLRQRRLVEVLDSGLWAITVAGIDELGSKELSLPEDRLLAPNSGAGVSPEEPLAIPQGSGVAAVDEKVGASS
jgi:curved DNA-binding protein